MDYSWVLSWSAWQVLLTCIQWLLMNVKSTTGFTREYLPLISAYSQILSAPQDSLVSVFNSSAITHTQCTSRVTWAQNMSYLQIFSTHEALLAFLWTWMWAVLYKNNLKIMNLKVVGIDHRRRSQLQAYLGLFPSISLFSPGITVISGMLLF